ncbi:3-oxoacyl-[acyl-carrier-protein] synthase, KASIII [Arcticibacter svalbardensis MN12-7]|uniref:3-oxoacyl-[acyl-carrier-protein] synthase, KASIII n=1 Tax=Arcticibacter svalbardensis MN12-7 TaxID=1150600 RepID=R9GYF4_9SPHI|nr:ketoacyl-ACP synthase III [Arcticibacter svalbardensis]EOR94014.1 3-oxoacyl-[acyl-carrier-protein] synthase, KASIII [Arcticibacter svalbardensis MN12-7]
MCEYINDIAYYLPKKSLSNADIESQHPEWSIEKISSKTGIENRFLSGVDEFCSDMAVQAANKLFNQNSPRLKQEIDYLILCTQNPDYVLPTTACIVQDRLGLEKSIGAIDVNLGCSGFIYSIGLAKGLISSGQASNVLVITSDTYSKLINPNDKGNKTIFGDAAAATLVSNKEEGLAAKIEKFVYGTDGSGYDNLIVKNGGSRNRISIGQDLFEDNVYIKNDSNLFMDGRAVFQFTNAVVPNMVSKTLEKNNLILSEIDSFIFHQANKFMLEKVRKKIGIPENKFIFNSGSVGNTVSSSIPIAFKNFIDEVGINTGEKIMLAGFGVGLSYGATIISIN